MIAELLTIILIVCLGIVAVWLFFKVVKAIFRLAILGGILLLLIALIQYLRGLV